MGQSQLLESLPYLLASSPQRREWFELTPRREQVHGYEGTARSVGMFPPPHTHTLVVTGSPALTPSLLATVHLYTLHQAASSESLSWDETARGTH